MSTFSTNGSSGDAFWGVSRGLLLSKSHKYRIQVQKGVGLKANVKFESRVEWEREKREKKERKREREKFNLRGNSMDLKIVTSNVIESTSTPSCK